MGNVDASGSGDDVIVKVEVWKVCQGERMSVSESGEFICWH